MSSRLRVLVVCPFGVVGGAERWLLQLLDASSRLHVDAVLLRDGPLREELERRGVRVRVHPTGRMTGQVGRSALWLTGLLRRHPAEVVLANGVKAAAVAVPAARLVGVPVVWAKHDHSFDRGLARPLARLADRLVATSEVLAKASARADAVVIPPPLPEKAAGRAAARRFWSRRGVELDGAPTLAMVTRLIPYKRVDDAIAALAEDRGPAWHLVVVGEDDYAAPGEGDRLRRLAISLGVTDRVRFTGPVEGAGRWLAAFDALAVLTTGDRTRPGGEGFGMSAVEAMRAGVPVVMADEGDVGGSAAVQGGVVVPPRSPAGVARALEALSDPKARRAAGKTGRASLQGHPDALECADRLAAVLAEAAARPGAGRGANGPAVSVVATVLDEEESIGGLLRSLAGQLRDEDEVLVVDGGSADRTAERVEQWAEHEPRVRLVRAPGTNIPSGRNAGIAQARNAVVACTDAGCLPDPGWLDALRAPFAEQDPPSLVTGVYRVVARSPFEEAMAAACFPDTREARRAGPLARLYGGALGRAFDPTMPTGRSVAFTRDAWVAVGGFPEGLAAAEDVTFGRAVARTGRRCVFSADAEVEWTQRPDLPSTVRMYWAYGFGDGLSGDRKLVGRNLARLVAYAGGAALALRGRPGRLAVAAGALAYLSLPWSRVRRRRRAIRVAALVPVALALKDLSKVAGCLGGLAVRRRSKRS